MKSSRVIVPLVLGVGGLLLFAVAPLAEGAQILVKAWNVDAQGDIPTVQPDGQTRMVKAPTLPANGLVAKMTAYGTFEVTVGKTHLAFDRDAAVKDYDLVSKVCTTKENSIVGGQYQVPGFGCKPVSAH